jgi:hypothetical protein
VGILSTKLSEGAATGVGSSSASSVSRGDGLRAAVLVVSSVVQISSGLSAEGMGATTRGPLSSTGKRWDRTASTVGEEDSSSGNALSRVAAMSE